MDPMMQGGMPGMAPPDMAMPGAGTMGGGQEPTCPMCGQPLPMPNSMPPGPGTMQPLPGMPPGGGGSEDEAALMAAIMGGGGMPMAGS